MSTKFLLMTEDIDPAEIDQTVLEEGAKKTYYLEGPFFQAVKRNRNKRIYPLEIAEREINAYQQTIKRRDLRAYGELNHPQSPTVSYERATHRMIALRMEGNLGIGKAKLINTDKGNLLKVFVDEGTRLGVSSRGLGTLGKNNVVNDDYQLVTFDIVSDPSGQECFIDGVMESAGWVMESGVWTKVELAELQQKIDNVSNRIDSAQNRATVLAAFDDLFKSLRA